MSEHSLLVSDITKRYNIPLGHLDFGYIEKCCDTKELEKILLILRSGEEGIYLELERKCEDRLASLNPKSRVLRKADALLKPGDLQKNEWDEIDQGLEDWTSAMKYKDDTFKTTKNIQPKGEEFADNTLPPVRSTVTSVNGTFVNGTANEKEKMPVKQKRVKPRDYKEWDKFDVDKELEQVDKDDEKVKKSTITKTLPDIDTHITSTGMSEEEKEVKATREKDKGNEAYRAGDYEEAILYYTRSISLMQTAPSINNRALAYLKIKKWEKALFDCRVVLDMEPNNIKALLRRGSAYKGKKEFVKAKADFERALELEPSNKRAEEFLAELRDAMKDVEKEKRKRKEKGRRMVIEEVEGDEGEEDQSHDQSGDEANGEITPESKTSAVEEEERMGTSDSDQVSYGESSDRNVEVESGDASVNLTTECDRLTPPKPSETESGGALADNQSDEHRQSDSSVKVDVGMKSDCSSDEVKRVNVSDGTQSDPSKADEGKAEPLNEQPDDMEDKNAKELTSEIPERPVLVQMVLPPAVAQLRESGNNLFRGGQYADAIAKYNSAIDKLEKEKTDQRVNLSLLYSNRAACELKVGNCSASMKDCGHALELVPHSIKPLLRRGITYEALEKYRHAYVDYKHVLSVDSTVELAFLGSTRCQNVLREQDGVRWREKLPPLISVYAGEVPLIVDSTGKPTTRPTTTPTTTPTTPSDGTPIAIASEKPASAPPSVTSTTTPAPSPVTEPVVPESEPTTEQKFENAKSEGNKCVQKGDFVKATDWYTQCITLLPDRTVGYTNRALCHLRRDQATTAEEDCSTALQLEADNIKAMFRRSQARKMLKKYKESLEDLSHLLKVDPKNTAAMKEMTLVKSYYREELLRMKDNLTSTSKSEKPRSAGNKKQRKRIVIQETESDEEESPKVKIPEIKSSKGRSPEVKSDRKEKTENKTKPESTKKSKSEKKGKKIVIEEMDSTKKDVNQEKDKAKPVKTDKKSTPNKNIKPTSTGLPVVPPSVPKLDKATPYEFIQAWNSLKKSLDLQPYADLLKQISPSDLPKLISNKLDGPMLTNITRCLEEKFSVSGELDSAYSILTNLAKVQRFQTISMFMSKSEKSVIENIVTRLQSRTSDVYDQSDLEKLRKCYNVR